MNVNKAEIKKQLLLLLPLSRNFNLPFNKLLFKFTYSRTALLSPPLQKKYIYIYYVTNNP
jgi:hypothetical protein